MFPQPFENLVNDLCRLPGIGRVQAQRLALFLFNREAVLNEELAENLIALKKIKLCANCFSLADDGLCSFCRNQNRDKTKLCLVETALDVITLEQTRGYSGLYFVLGNLIDPLAGFGPEKVRFRELKARLKDKKISEVILAFDQTLSADQTKLQLKEIIPSRIKITELAKGLPRGSDLDYIDQETLARAIEERKKI